MLDLKKGPQAKPAGSAKDARIAKLEEVVAQKNDGISELMEECRWTPFVGQSAVLDNVWRY